MHQRKSCHSQREQACGACVGSEFPRQEAGECLRAVSVARSGTIENRGFDFHCLRHATVLLDIRLFDATAKPNEHAFAANSAIVAPAHPRRTAVFDRGFGGRIFRHCTVLLWSHCSKRQQKQRVAVAASSAKLPLITAQTVASRRGFGGCIFARGTHGQQAQVA